MSKLIPFNLEKALAGEPVVTRQGDTVGRVVCFTRVDKADYPVHAEVEVDGEWCAVLYTLRGKIYNHEEARDEDLFMAPKTKYLNVYSPGNGWTHASRAAADRAAASSNRIACLEYTEGEGL